MTRVMRVRTRDSPIEPTVTNEMIHISIIPGAPDRFRESPDDWLEEALANC